jgi:hypothetical protein
MQPTAARKPALPDVAPLERAAPAKLGCSLRSAGLGVTGSRGRTKSMRRLS